AALRGQGLSGSDRVRNRAGLGDGRRGSGARKRETGPPGGTPTSPAPGTGRISRERWNDAQEGAGEGRQAIIVTSPGVWRAALLGLGLEEASEGPTTRPMTSMARATRELAIPRVTQPSRRETIASLDRPSPAGNCLISASTKWEARRSATLPRAECVTTATF